VLDMTTFTKTTTIDASPAEVWSALADIASISEWNPGVRDSYLLGEAGTGMGATRYCNLGGRNYVNEAVAECEEERALTMRITKSNLPFAAAEVRFRMQPYGNGTDVSVTPDYLLKYGPIGRLADRWMVRARYEKGMEALLAGLKDHVERNREHA